MEVKVPPWGVPWHIGLGSHPTHYPSRAHLVFYLHNAQYRIIGAVAKDFHEKLSHLSVNLFASVIDKFGNMKSEIDHFCVNKMFGNFLVDCKTVFIFSL